MKIGKPKWMAGVVLIFLLGFVVHIATATEESSQPQIGKSKEEPEVEKLKEKAIAAEKLKEKKEAAEKAKREAAEKAKREAAEKAKAKAEEWTAKLSLPEDTSPRLTARQLQIRGNSLITTEELLEDLPFVYNASDKPITKADSSMLYDLRAISDVVQQPGQPHEVSTRAIQGLTQYILSVYQEYNYGGVYVYVPAEAISADMKLTDDILPIVVIEATVSETTITYRDPDANEVEKGRLLHSVLEEWLPVEAGEVANQKELDDFVNLLNLNPDRYVSATVSKGAEPNTLAIGYDIYEANPWHFFVQIDNAGTSDRQWIPREGIINTNLTGRDDRLTVMAQVPLDSNPKDNYMVFGSYDFPLWTPRLRLNLYGARNEFDVSAAGGIDFVGKGSVVGGLLRYTAFQHKGWFVDLLGGLRREKSTVTPSLFPQFLGSDVTMGLWEVGVDLHRSDDMSSTSLVLNRLESMGGSSAANFNKARTNANPDFVVLTFAASHHQFLDSDKINRLLGSFRYIRPNERLVPARMTTFGGMYTVRGYEESGIVADGGMLWSVQYEYDLVKADEADKRAAGISPEEKPWLRKVAPLAFFDYGRANIRDSLAGEDGSVNLYSVGLGILAEVGAHFNAGVYYGFPLQKTVNTDKGEGRVNVSMMLRW